MSSEYSASAPGSLMLLGEYAVLHDKFAVVCAVDKRISVRLVPRPDKVISIRSTLGELTTTLDALQPQPPFHFVLATLQSYQRRLPSGCDVHIKADFSAQIGFASSAAVTTALLAVLRQWLQLELTPAAMIRRVRAIIRQVQGVGSGADAAACVLGGLIAYRARPFIADKLPGQPALTALYSGYKTPTGQAIQQVTRYFASQPLLYRQVIQAIGTCAVQGIGAIKQQDWQSLGKIMQVQQGLLDALQVNTPELTAALALLRATPGILGAKISGSGLGDCVIGLGVATAIERHEPNNYPGLQWLPVQMATQGVTCEKN